MPSLLHISTRGERSLVCLAGLVLLCLASRGVRGASLREHRLRGSESEPPRGNARQAPSADMLKALEYIESLRQRTGTDSQQPAPLAGGYGAGRTDDAEKLRAVLRLASAPSRGRIEEEEEEEEGRDEEENEEGREDKSEELLQAVLSTLQQTQRATKLRPSYLGRGDGGATGVEDGVYPRVQPKQHGIMPHKKLPLMFEDEEEGEGDEAEEDDGGQRGNPFKRTNENVEEKYTPQNLATLQSVFDELDKLTNGKTAHKRQDEGDATEEDEEEGEGMFKVRNLAYDDELADWGPLQEQGGEEEDEEEDEEDNHKYDRSLDYADDEDDEVGNEDDDGDGESYPVKRSKDADDVTNLVDYYILKVLEKTEEEEQKRAIEEEEKQRAERRAAQSQYREDIDPQAVYQLIQISQKYQIPPEDLMDMLKTGETPRSQKSGQPSRAEDKLPQTSSKKTHKTPDFYSRRLPERQKAPDSLRAQEILRILGFGGPENKAPARKQTQHKITLSRLHSQPAAAAAAAGGAGRPGAPAPAQRRLPAAAKHDYDDAVDEDELAAYLAAQMLARYPGAAYGAASAGQKRDEAGQTGSFEQAMQDYLDQMDSDKDLNEKRRSEDDGRGGGGGGGGGLDGEAVIKLLSYLNPETEEGDADAEAAPGI